MCIYSYVYYHTVVPYLAYDCMCVLRVVTVDCLRRRRMTFIQFGIYIQYICGVKTTFKILGVRRRVCLDGN